MIRGYDVNQIELVNELARKLEEEKLTPPPDWAMFVKTGSAKDRVPSQDNWWYLRAASIMRRMYVNKKPIGVNRLRNIYGDKEKNRYSGKHFKPASGAVIRHILQELEKAELIKKVKVQDHFGRTLTPKGISFTDNAAKETAKKYGISE
ncbi:MAG: 30S ribosomal protein S19e [Candidatus Parvarchaeota archaeon]|nr:30S ribosomal protein S19e [Candidatus Parvarchaeota archaeon]MCL5018949.1 30S ribosomal protein S19e [Patescibacteria group bacterium]MCW1296033.1 30S ribosomal protein S19e [Candidatus Parvarchaeum tengchongense]MCW1299202.1 30S ribosomal protein S19e [Candidatus Parvarchaeum tengchongense]MCW1311911.1 30S ribosomal protein S19e [Candidatus Parvarchaeum tengchongense]